jgi:hypothetical protein
MSTNHNTVELPLTLADIARVQRWYRSYALKNATIDAHDVVLNAHLDTVRVAMEDRLVVRADAIRHRSDSVRFQHTGAERRSRLTVPGIAHSVRPQRIIRPALAVTH